MTIKNRLKEVWIRWMIRRDMDEVNEIEQLSFEHQWTPEDFLRVLRQRNAIGMVGEIDEKVVGFVVYELHKHRLEILNLAVAPSCRRMNQVVMRSAGRSKEINGGVGASMVTLLKDKLADHRRTKIGLCVRETNLQAQNFFKAQGFKGVKVLPDYYDLDNKEHGEDAYRMEYTLSGHQEELQEVVSNNRISHLLQ